MVFFLFFLLIVALFLEGTVTTLPLVFICLLCLTIFIRNLSLFIVAFLAGILLDAFALRSLGETSIFFLLLIFLILLYQRKYEINSYPFVLMASFLGSLLYLSIFGYGNAVWVACASAVIAVVIFAMSRFLHLKYSA